ncbi:MAG: hypothetical protein HYY24_12575 [Verrucomicrobia bacterium]|nr:hypothetical protein [Verrucomicrobiota bacterium]
MTTTLDVSNDLLKRVMALTHAPTPEQAILEAMADFSQQRSLEEAVAKLGTFEDFMTADELRAMRASN